MKKIYQLSFRMQIFLSSLILVIFPTVLLSTINAISKTSTITSEYNTSTAATLTQMNQSLDTLLETSDIVSVHAPLNEHTEHLMNLNAFCKMKKSAIFLNLGRGPIVVEADLKTALETNEIQAAGLDVLCAEPMSEDNPLRGFTDSNRLLITPHIAWASIEARTKLMNIIAGQIKEFFGL